MRNRLRAIGSYRPTDEAASFDLRPFASSHSNHTDQDLLQWLLGLKFEAECIERVFIRVLDLDKQTTEEQFYLGLYALLFEAMVSVTSNNVSVENRNRIMMAVYDIKKSLTLVHFDPGKMMAQDDGELPFEILNTLSRASFAIGSCGVLSAAERATLERDRSKHAREVARTMYQARHPQIDEIIRQVEADPGVKKKANEVKARLENKVSVGISTINKRRKALGFTVSRNSGLNQKEVMLGPCVNPAAAKRCSMSNLRGGSEIEPLEIEDLERPLDRYIFARLGVPMPKKRKNVLQETIVSRSDRLT